MVVCASFMALLPCAGIVVGSAPAYAQSALPSSSAQPQGAGRGEAIPPIIVTARKREELLQDTPLAITVYGAEDIIARSAATLPDLVNFAPNVTFDATAPLSGSSNAASVFIRGVGQSDFVITTDPGVGIYLDGVYLARSTGGVLDLLDIERVEVLRGPQGTLFGKNNIGGAINITTIHPQFDALGVEAELIAGRFDRFDLRAVFNIPITERFAIRLSGVGRTRDGYGLRIRTGEELGGIDRATVRGSASWEPTDKVRLFAAVDYSEGDEQSPVTTLVSGSRTATIGAPQTILPGFLYNNLIVGADGLALCQRPGSPVPFCGFPGLIELPVLPAGTLPFDERWITGDLFTSGATGPTGSDYDVLGITGTADVTVGDAILRSITAYRSLSSDFARDPDGSPLVIIDTANSIRHEQFSQELRLDGTAFGESLQWLLGLYYLTEDGSDRGTAPFVRETFDIINRLGLGCTLLPGATGLPTPIFLPVCPNIFRIDAAGEGVTVDNESLAAFGEIIFEASEQVSITAGARWTRDRKRIDASGFLVGGFPAIAAPKAQDTFTAFTPRLIVDFQPHEDLTLYASYAAGFKSGGFNQRYGAPLPAPTSFRPEKVKSVELGMKAELWENRIRINTAAFHARYDDIQVVVFDNSIPRTINAAAGKISGVEIEATILPVKGLSLAASYAYLDARYTRLDPAIIGSFGVPITNPLQLDYRFVNAPRHSVSGSAQYEWDLGTRGLITLRGDLSYKSSVANDAVNTPELIQDPVWLANARVTYQPAGENWSFSLFGTNLADERYITSGAADEAAFGAAELNAAPPREWGASIAMSF